MEYFLENIARSLYAEFGNKLNRHCLVFPNRRAGLYFMKYLATGITKPVWAPAVYTINELFRSSSSLQVAAQEILLFELYKVFRRIRKTAESFDDFYFWGDMLLDDFDDVDKYMVKAQMLFSNVQDIKNIDNQFRGLTEEQNEIIRKFWVNFEPEKPTREKAGFIDIWASLYELYSGFREALRDQHIAYEGMIFRDLAENEGNDIYAAPDWDMFHFIGFNALNECEKGVMKRFREAGKARFYWDYDISYIKSGKLNSAGFFMRKNLEIFGNDMAAGWGYDTLLGTGAPGVKRRVIETSSDVAQVKLIPALIGQLPDLTPATAHHTAIVLADENLLMPVLTSLPENIGDINITMGYPLKQSLVYILVKHLMDLQRNVSIVNGILHFGFRDVINVMRHSLMQGFLEEEDRTILRDITDSNILWVSSDRFARSGNLSAVFTGPSTAASLSEYFKNILALVATCNEGSSDEPGSNSVSHNIRNEFIYRVILSLNRLETLVNRGDVVLSAETYMRILDKLLRMQSVPFSGEPLSGIQVMGILETRTLDFKNLILLSVNEGVLPSASTGSSFIPFSLREAFGLPSINHRESVFAYHFYRLLHRAENVTFLYNSNSEGLRSGEMSRFLTQMKYDSVLTPEFLDLNFQIKSQGSISEVIERTEGHTRQLHTRFLARDNKRIFSPTAINTWLNCSMKFFYRYVNGIMEPEVTARDIDPGMLGEILHDAMKSLYSDFTGSVLTADRIDMLIKDRQGLERIITTSISEKFSSIADRKIEGNELIIRDVLMAYILKILRYDKSAAPLKILHLESVFNFPITIATGGQGSELMTGGKVDRIDITGGTIRIVDYKSGSVADKINSMEDLFGEERKKEADAWLQTLLYSEAYIKNKGNAALRPSVYKVKKLSPASESDKLKIKIDKKTEIPVDDYDSVRDDFMKNLRMAIDDIFISDKPFVMTSDIRGKCSYCSYRKLCLR